MLGHRDPNFTRRNYLSGDRAGRCRRAWRRLRHRLGRSDPTVSCHSFIFVNGSGVGPFMLVNGSQCLAWRPTSSRLCGLMSGHRVKVAGPYRELLDVSIRDRLEPRIPIRPLVMKGSPVRVRASALRNPLETAGFSLPVDAPSRHFHASWLTLGSLRASGSRSGVSQLRLQRVPERALRYPGQHGDLTEAEPLGVQLAGVRQRALHAAVLGVALALLARPTHERRGAAAGQRDVLGAASRRLP
jgi:hypothetical protein